MTPFWSDDVCAPDSPASPFVPKLSSSIVLTGRVRVYGFTVYSTKATTQYVAMFDASSLPADGAVPIVNFPVLGNNQVSAYYGPMGRVFMRGVVLCNSSTDTSKTIGSADCLFDVQLDYLY